MNGEEIGLNRYETKVSQKITTGSSEWGLESSEVEWVVTLYHIEVELH